MSIDNALTYLPPILGAIIFGALEVIVALSKPRTRPQRIFQIYLLAMFSRRATGGAVLVAGVAGSVTSYYVAYHSTIGFMWPSTFGLAATLLVGWVCLLVTRARPDPVKEKLTWYEVMATRK